MPSPRPLANPADLFFAIGDTLLELIPEVTVGNYDEFDKPVGDATVLIEFERTMPATRGTDGRYAHDLAITLHAVVARWRRWAPLEAVNLATVIERIVDDNRWSLPPGQCEPPDPETGLLPIPTDLHVGNKVKYNGRFARVAAGFNNSEGLLDYRGYETLENVAAEE